MPRGLYLGADPIGGHQDRNGLHGPAPLSAVVHDAGDEPTGELLVWVKDGYLSGLEYAWWSDEPPQHLPAPGQVHVAK